MRDRDNPSLHIYDGKSEYSVTNIRDILFNVRNEGNSDSSLKTRENMNLVGEGGCGIRHFMAINLFLVMMNAYMNRTTMAVAVVPMVNHTALPTPEASDCPESGSVSDSSFPDGPFLWTSDAQASALAAFYYGYILTQIPAALLSKRYGAKMFIGVGMLVNSLFSMMIPSAAKSGLLQLKLVRFVQGLGQGPVIPCTYTLLAKWTPPCERSRMMAMVLTGGQIGAMITLFIGGMLCNCEICGGWDANFYFFSCVSVMLSMFFIFFMCEDPEHCPIISDTERRYILSELGKGRLMVPTAIPWGRIFRSTPFWAILFAHMGHNYGYETLLTELPTFMQQILHTHITDYGFIGSLPYLCMFILGIVDAVLADWMMLKGKLSPTCIRKIFNSVSQYGPAIGLCMVVHIGCNPLATIIVLTIGLGLNGAHMSGFKVNHLDIGPNFAGILVGMTNLCANVMGLLAQEVASVIIKGKPSARKWDSVFFIAAAVYTTTGTIYNLMGSGQRQRWDTEEEDSIKTPTRVTFQEPSYYGVELEKPDIPYYSDDEPAEKNADEKETTPTQTDSSNK